VAKKRERKRKVVYRTERKEAWFRIIVAIISGIILKIWAGLVGIIVILHWLIVVFSGKRNKDLAMFCEYFNTASYMFMRYLTFVSNKRPFPFSRLERISKFY
jgi:hypothetical protein